MALVSSLGCGLLSGLANGYLSLQNTLDDYIEDMKYPDVVVETEVTTRDTAEKLRSIPGVEAVDARLIGNLIMVGKGGVFYSMQAMSFSESEFQGTHYWEESEEEAEYPILIEYRFSKLNDLHAGDTVEIRADDRSWNCMVKAVISRPEMLAFHKIGDMTVTSTDIGYVYVPSELLAKIDNPEYDDAKSEWNKNNNDYLRKKKDAENEHDKAIGKLGEAEKTLEEKRAELEEKLKEAEKKKKELLEGLDKIKAGLAELEKKEKELADKKKELDKAAEQLRLGKKEFEAGRTELNQKKQLLDSTKALLTANRELLLKQLDELNKKEKELVQNKALLQAAYNEIEKNTRELDNTEKQLVDTKKQLIEKQAQLKTLQETVCALREYADAVNDIITMSECAADPYELARKASQDISAFLSDKKKMDDITALLSDETAAAELLSTVGIEKDNLQDVIAEYKFFTGKMTDYEKRLTDLLSKGTDPVAAQQLMNDIVRDSRESWQRVSQKIGTPDLDLDKVTKELDNVIKETDNGLAQIAAGEKQIADGRKLIAEKKKEADDAAAQIADGEKQLKQGKIALTDGFAQIDDGLKQVEAGYVEYEKYVKKLRGEEKKLRDGQAEYDEYYKQFIDGQKTLTQTREELLKTKKEIEDGLEQIASASEEGKSGLQKGENELRSNKNKAEDSWIDALKRFKDVEQELLKAKKELDEWKGYDEFCNQFLLRLEPGADAYTAVTRAEKILAKEKLKIKNSYTYEDSAVKLSRDLNVDPLEVMSLYVPAVFFVVSLIAEFLFMSFLIRQCRREIGILRAIGYSRNQIVALFCCINILVSAGAVLLGQLVGFGVTRYIGAFFQDYFYLHYFNYSVHWERVLISVALTVVVGQIATVFSTGYVSRIYPSEAMTRPAPAGFTHEGRLLSRLRIPPFFKYCISSLLRNKKRLLFSIVCLSSSVVLVFAAFSFDLSKDLILSDRFEDRIHYDCEIFLDADPSKDFLDKLNKSELTGDAEAVYYYKKTISGNGKAEDQTIMAVSSDSELIGIYDETRNRVFATEEGILLEKHTAEPLGVSQGDTVEIGGKQIKVAGITEEYEGRSHYISIDSAKALGKPDLYSVICKVDKQNEVDLMEFLSGEESYIYAAFTYKIYAGIEDGFNAFSVVSLVALAFAVMIGSVIIVNTTCTNLQEQKKELCVLRTLGFQYSGISVRLLTQAAVYYIFACAVGIPGGIATTKLILNKLEIESRSYPFVNDYRVYTFTMLLVLAYVLISHMISMRTIKKWDMVETVKDKE